MRLSQTQIESRPVRRLEARYNAAQTTDDNRRYWANADVLDADSANSPAVRRILRSRARYEIGNSPYAKGMVLTLANDVVGTGPRLQMLTDDEDLNALVETKFATWTKAIRLASKLRTMRMARVSDGEAFGVLTTNPILNSPVKLDFKLVEADQVTTPVAQSLTPGVSRVDGIEFDEWGNPRLYYVLAKHPGAQLNLFSIFEGVTKFDEVMAADMIHWFRVDRPGQHRGVPDITASLERFSQLSRYTEAVIAAAETAAEFALVIQSDAPAEEQSELVAMDTVELEKRVATVLPVGWKLGQSKAEQPATTHDQFTKTNLQEIARPLLMPFNVASGNSSGYNYASGRLDHQTYFKAIDVDRKDMEIVILDRILVAWLVEASHIPSLSGLRLGNLDLSELGHRWFWSGREHVDPLKEAKAQGERLDNNTTTLASEYAGQGKDWDTELRQRAKELQLMDKLGLSVSDSTAQDSQREFANVEDEEKE